jgi:hypothetical protein
MLCKFVKVHSIQSNAALQNKNHTQKPSLKTSAMLIHKGFQPMRQGGKLFIERNFGDKKIFSCSFIGGEDASCKI